jgi:hypothetical protein
VIRYRRASVKERIREARVIVSHGTPRICWGDGLVVNVSRL